MSIKCLIVDDEPLAINVIKSHLKGFSDLELVSTCHDALEAFETLRNNDIQLMFLDINMPELSGIDFVKSLEHKPLVVFTTAYREYAVTSYELDGFDYLVKPIALPRFVKTIEKVLDHFKQKAASKKSKKITKGSFFIKVDKRMIKLFYDEILFVESLKDYVRIVTKNEKYVSHYNLGGITKLLPQNSFMRVHRSYTVALDKIKALDGNDLIIADHVVPIGRNYQQQVKQQLNLDQI